MRRIEIKHWNGGFHSPKIIGKIRQKIAGAIKTDRTVLIDFEGACGIPPEVFLKIVEGWDAEKVKVITCGRNK